MSSRPFIFIKSLFSFLSLSLRDTTGRIVCQRNGNRFRFDEKKTVIKFIWFSDKAVWRHEERSDSNRQVHWTGAINRVCQREILKFEAIDGHVSATIRHNWKWKWWFWEEEKNENTHPIGCLQLFAAFPWWIPSNQIDMTNRVEFEAHHVPVNVPRRTTTLNSWPVHIPSFPCCWAPQSECCLI